MGWWKESVKREQLREGPWSVSIPALPRTKQRWGKWVWSSILIEEWTGRESPLGLVGRKQRGNNLKFGQWVLDKSLTLDYSPCQESGRWWTNSSCLISSGKGLLWMGKEPRGSHQWLEHTVFDHSFIVTMERPSWIEGIMSLMISTCYYISLCASHLQPLPWACSVEEKKILGRCVEGCKELQHKNSWSMFPRGERIELFGALSSTPRVPVFLAI